MSSVLRSNTNNNNNIQYNLINGCGFRSVRYLEVKIVLSGQLVAEFCPLYGIGRLSAPRRLVCIETMLKSIRAKGTVYGAVLGSKIPSVCLGTRRGRSWGKCLGVCLGNNRLMGGPTG